MKWIGNGYQVVYITKTGTLHPRIKFEEIYAQHWNTLHSAVACSYSSIKIKTNPISGACSGCITVTNPNIWSSYKKVRYHISFLSITDHMNGNFSTGHASGVIVQTFEHLSGFEESWTVSGSTNVQPIWMPPTSPKKMPKCIFHALQNSLPPRKQRVIDKIENTKRSIASVCLACLSSRMPAPQKST